MATTGFCYSAKSQLATGTFNFTTTTGGQFGMLLIKASPILIYGPTQTNIGTPGIGAPTTSNVGTDEVSGTGYTTGGFLWSVGQNITPVTSGTIGYWSWSVNPSWTNASFSTSAAIIYQVSTGNTLGVFDLGGIVTVTSGNLTIVLPTNNEYSATFRIT